MPEAMIAKHIRVADDKANYDAACKRLLSEKIILAWIMKHCLEEFRNFDVDEIAQKYIEGQPQIADIPVNQDEGEIDNCPVISGMETEDVTMTEGLVTYDIRFRAAVPLSGELIQLIINVEAQNDFYPGYPLIKRGIYYCSRMISSQYGKEFTESHYEKIKKVYSIWICMNPPKSRENTITRYYVEEENLVGRVKEEKRNYDLLAAVMICLGRPEDLDETGVLKLLNVLLSTETKPEEKCQILEKDFSIKMTRDLESEVSLMCNLSEGVERKGIEKGIQQGIQQGIQRGIQQGKIYGTIEVYREDKLPEDEILKRIRQKFSLTEDEAKEYMAYRECV